MKVGIRPPTSAYNPRETMQYLYWLIAISVGFALLERLRPARPGQPLLRPEFGNDLVYLFFNGHVYALLTAGMVGWFSLQTRDALQAMGLLPEQGLLAGQAFPVQCLVFFVVADFLQWCVHVSLHRIPWLWQFHKIHHSIHRMDWAGNFRFHWVEIIVYRTLLYIPLLLLGAPGDAVMVIAVFGTLWGHFNHANVRADLGPLGYLFNSPRMHLWHHDASSEGGVAKNFGIVLSVWDFLFSTAYWPRDRTPERLGFAGDGEVPENLPGQLLFPLTRRQPS